MTSKQDAAENARLVRFMKAWLAEHTRCYCDFPNEEIGEDGVIYCDPCSLRDALSLNPCDEHRLRFPKGRK